MRALTVWIDCPEDDIVMVAPERDEVTGPPTMQTIREGIMMGKVEEAINLYLVHLMARAGDRQREDES